MSLKSAHQVIFELMSVFCSGQQMRVGTAIGPILMYRLAPRNTITKSGSPMNSPLDTSTPGEEAVSSSQPQSVRTVTPTATAAQWARNKRDEQHSLSGNSYVIFNSLRMVMAL